MLLEDANDICSFLAATGRTIARSKWCDEDIAAIADSLAESFF